MSNTLKYHDLTNPLDQNNHIETLIDEKFNRELRKRIATRLETDHDIKKGKSSGKIFRFLPLLSGIAASFLVLFMFVNNNQSSDILNHSVIIDSVDNALVHPGQTKGEASSESNRNEAIAAFNLQNFTKSYAAFSQIESLTEEDLFYKAMCMFYLKDFDTANAELLPLLKSDSTFFEEVRWYLAMSEIKLDNLDAAKDLLSGISEGQWNYTKSQDILSNISTSKK